MATVDITGTIQDAAGQPVQDVVVRLLPAPRSPESPEAIGGIGIVLDPVEVLTDAAGEFLMPAVVGFTYQLQIDAIGLKETFTAPNVATVVFHTLGVRPVISAALDYTDAAGVDHTRVGLDVARLPTVLERFTEIVLESGATSAGPWTAVIGTPVELAAGQTHYEVDDTAPAEWYRAQYKNGTDLSELTPPFQAGGFSEALLVSEAELRDVYLFGVSLTDGSGAPFPAVMYPWYIKAAVAWLEKELDIRLVAHDVIGETHDHYAQDYGRWGYFQLTEYPIQRVDGVRFQYPSMTDAVVIDLSWVVVEDGGAHGVLQIVPGQGNIADVLLIPGSLMPMWSGAFGRVPGVWRFDYRAGFEQGDIPFDLKHIIGMAAAIGVLNIAGDLIAGAGIANFSVSIPGLSQSIGTTSSATNAGYGSRILEYQKEIKQLLPVAKRFYGKTAKLYVA